eukprot:s2407_g5.t1
MAASDVQKFLQTALGLALAGKLLGPHAPARSVLYDGAVVDVVADLDLKGALGGQDTSQPIHTPAEPAKKPEKPEKVQVTAAPVRRTRLDFLTPSLRRQLFDPPPAPPTVSETKAPKPSEAVEEGAFEESREKVGLKLVADRAPRELRWRLAVADEARRFEIHGPNQELRLMH